MTSNRYMSRQELSDYMSVSVRTVDRWRSEGLIRGVRLGTIRRFAIREIEALVQHLRKEERHHA